MATPNIVPRADSEGGLGTASKYWASAYIDLIYVGAGKMGRDADNLIDFSTDDRIKFEVGGSSNRRADLFLDDGAVINFNNGNVTLTHSNNTLTLADSDVLAFGAGNDLKIYHNATNSNIENFTGTLQIIQTVDDEDIVFRCDDGSGGHTPYITLDGELGYTVASKPIKFLDNISAAFGSTGNGDYGIVHDGSHAKHENYTGDIKFINYTTDGDIIFQSDDGSGGTAEYFRLDGGAAITLVSKEMRFGDSVPLKLGGGPDLEMYHDGSNSYIHNNNDGGSLYIKVDQTDKDIVFQSDDGSGGVATYFFLDGSSATHDGSATTNLYTNWPDNSRISFGTSHDLSILHNAYDSLVQNLVGDLHIQNLAGDKDIIFKADDGTGGAATEYFRLDGSLASGGFVYTNWPDNSQVTLGSSRDLRLYHTGTDSIIETTGTGDLYIRQSTDDKDLIFQSDNGSGGVTTYFRLYGNHSGNPITHFPDNSQLHFGDGFDFRISHDGSQSILNNQTGNLEIVNNADDGDIIFKCDDGSGGITEYFRLDGSEAQNRFFKNVKFNDSVEARFGTGNDLKLYHDGSNSYIDNGTGIFRITQSVVDGDLVLRADNGSGSPTPYITLDGGDVSTIVNTIKVMMPNLPTSDPSNAGQLWNDSGTLKISAG